MFRSISFVSNKSAGTQKRVLRVVSTVKHSDSAIARMMADAAFRKFGNNRELQHDGTSFGYWTDTVTGNAIVLDS